MIMRRAFLFLFSVTLLGGCATYKELLPDPTIDPAEKGYIGIYDGDKVFLLHKETKNYIRFPAAPDDKFFLVLRVPPKSRLASSLTRGFDWRGTGETISDEAEGNDTLSVYPIDKASEFFWIIGNVKEEIPLFVRYRYVPQWRYTFENKHVLFKDLLTRSAVDRSTYNAIGPAFDLETVDLAAEHKRLDANNEQAVALNRELVALGDLFPPKIAASQDTAYLQYRALMGNLEKELAFQEMYGAVLDIFQKERGTRGNPDAFLESAPAFTRFLRDHEQFSGPIREKAKKIFASRLAPTTAFYDGLVLKKKDLETLTFLDQLMDLSDACGTAPPPDLSPLIRFIHRFNIETSALVESETEMRKVETEFGRDNGLPSEILFSNLVRRGGEAGATVPQSQAVHMQKYGNSPCALMLDKEIQKARTRALAMQNLYKRGGDLVASIGRNDWKAAETDLIEIDRRDEWSSYPVLSSQKDTILKKCEREVFSRVIQQTRQRARAFIVQNESSSDNISALYEDSAFVPLYLFRFSVLGPDETVRKRGIVRQELAYLRDITFPENAIKNLYREFQKDPSDVGVRRARAIVEHGKRYKGEDKQVRGLISECDANVAKAIMRPREYRRLYALPVKTAGAGKHEYIFRIQVKIPTSAKFPVYDVNIKLPEEVASRAGSSQWYKSITINNKPVKNEGRFRITSPTVESNYESQISPVQVDKEGKNVLEVRFIYPGSRVFEVSAMAQVPIIRKNN